MGNWRQHLTQKCPLNKFVEVIKEIKVPVVFTGGKRADLAAEEM